MIFLERIMDTSRIIGNESVKRELEKPFHAYIIEGPHGSGKTLLANLIAQANVCVSDETKPCGKCSSCLKYLLFRNQCLHLRCVQYVAD